MKENIPSGLVNGIPTNCHDVEIALIICLSIVILGILALIGILVFHHQVILRQQLQERNRDLKEKEEARIKRIADFRAKKLDCIKGKEDDYSSNKKEYKDQIDEYLKEECPNHE